MKQQPWLISFEYYALHVHKDRSASRIGPKKTIVLIHDPPWKYLAMEKGTLRRVLAGEQVVPENKAYQRADEIIAVYWAVQIPVGGLTEEEVDSLS